MITYNNNINLLQQKLPKKYCLTTMEVLCGPPLSCNTQYGSCMVLYGLVWFCMVLYGSD